MAAYTSPANDTEISLTMSFRAVHKNYLRKHCK